jgi:hypothetical protein
VRGPWAGRRDPGFFPVDDCAPRLGRRSSADSTGPRLRAGAMPSWPAGPPEPLLRAALPRGIRSPGSRPPGSAARRDRPPVLAASAVRRDRPAVPVPLTVLRGRPPEPDQVFRGRPDVASSRAGRDRLPAAAGRPPLVRLLLLLLPPLRGLPPDRLLLPPLPPLRGLLPPDRPLPPLPPLRGLLPPDRPLPPLPPDRLPRPAGPALPRPRLSPTTCDLPDQTTCMPDSIKRAEGRYQR